MTWVCSMQVHFKGCQVVQSLIVYMNWVFNLTCHPYLSASGDETVAGDAIESTA